ncbi:MAG: hypothetical protein R3Y21_01055 [Mycoplasmatota bacterium]
MNDNKKERITEIDEVLNIILNASDNNSKNGITDSIGRTTKDTNNYVQNGDADLKNHQINLNDLKDDEVKVNNNISRNRLSKKKKVIFIVIPILFVLSMIIFILVSNNDFFCKSEEINNFLISNGEKYALFNSNGEQLTEFIYDSSYNSYINGGIILSRDNIDVLIDKEGKEVLVGNEDSYLFIKGILYSFLNNDENDEIISGLYAGNGELIYSNEYNVLSFLGSVTNYYDDDYAIITDDLNIIVLNYKYEEILEIEKPDSSDNIYAYSDDGYLSLNSNNYFYLIDLENAKVVFEEETEIQYDVNVDDVGNIFLSQRYIYGENNESFIFLDNDYNKINYDEKCFSFSTISGSNSLYQCKTSTGTYYLTEKFLINELNVVYEYSYNSYVYLQDDNYYIYHNGKTTEIIGADSFISNNTSGYYQFKYNGIDKKTILYNHDGTLIAELEGNISSIDITDNDMFIIKEYISGGEYEYSILSSSGDLIVKSNDILSAFKTNVFYARTNNTIDNYDSYLINSNGDVITDLYLRITNVTSDYYYAEGEVNCLINEVGEVIVNEVDNYVTYNNYIKIEKNNGDIEYYTLDFKLFYTLTK